MFTFLLRRLSWSVVVLFFASLLTFFVGYKVPADPARMIAGPNASVETVRSISHQLGLDQPFAVQYGRFLGHALQGDLGRSYKTEQQVLPTILERFPYTLALALSGLAFEVLIGASIGMIAAGTKVRAIDGLASTFVLFTLAVPSFWLGIILLYVFGFRFPILPLGGADSGVISLLLPALTLGLAGAGYYARVGRASLLEVLGEDYIRTARAKGVSPRQIMFKHAFKNALRPLVTMTALDLGVLLGGALIIEQVFGWPGIGTLAWQAVQNIDLPMIMGTVLFSALCIVLANIVVDVLYSLIDPRVTV
ncbi:ABC transporter permease (plasmid) [Deinococcus sp. KNUC1210]|uniref:ABC transporter permease n=1 Tax=Deinococcus sp. KNUC1210 TaxID=2917691 RepID=UPI001EEFD8A3|nr:ABC transporter permease [Deinococcus sp. KNUC1210]ULH17058.1 ABC transporter permease [Deinococcus sp. KNUC1210]